MTARLQRQNAALRSASQAAALWPEDSATIPRPARRYLHAAHSLVLGLGRDDWALLLASAGEARVALLQAAATMAADQASAVLERKRFRRDRWHAYVNADIAAGGRRTFRWVRQPALQEPPALVRTPEGL